MILTFSKLSMNSYKNNQNAIILKIIQKSKIAMANLQQITLSQWRNGAARGPQGGFPFSDFGRAREAYFTPGGIFSTESRFRDDVATKSLRIVYIERRKPKIELRHVDQERSTQSSFFDLIGSAEASSSFTNSNNNVIKDGCYYQTIKAVATRTKGRMKMRRIIGTRANGRMLTTSGLTFSAHFHFIFKYLYRLQISVINNWSAGSVATLAIDRKSRMSFYFFMGSRALIVLPNNAKYACPDCKSIVNCRTRDEMH